MGIRDAASRMYQDAMRRVRQDSFVNALTGVGTGRDKRTGSAYCVDAILQPVELDNLFTSNDLVNTIVSKVVDDAMREGFEVKRRRPAGDEARAKAAKASGKPAPKTGKQIGKPAPAKPTTDALPGAVAKPGEEPVEPAEGLAKDEPSEEDDLAAEQEMAEQIEARCKELLVREKVYSGALWGRLFGGGGVILGVEGGGNPAAPLKDEKAKALKFLIDVDRQDLIPNTWAGIGEVETFLWTPTLPNPAATANISGTEIVQGSPIVIHASRVILFPGAKTTNRGKARNQGWDHSVVQRCYNAIKGVDGMWASVEHMFSDMSQAVFKLQGFVSAMAEVDGQASQNFQTRLQLMDTMRSVARAIMLDAGDERGQGEESFEVVERAALTGVDGLIDKAFIRLACAARMPVTVLMGQSPAGMDATGDSDLELWTNEVQTFRRHVVEPRLERIVHLIARECGDSDPTLWGIEWPNLRHSTAKEDAEIDEIKVRTALSLVTGQVALPEELALSLEKVAPNLGLEIDEAARELALEDALDQLVNPPDVMGMGVDPVTGEPVAPESTPAQGKPGAPPAKPGAAPAPKKQPEAA